jgi:uncharacterized protein (TIGR03083 family)
METLKPILTSNLFPKIDGKLLELLRSLSKDHWQRAALPKWTIKDVAAHLLDGNLRRLSMGRDGFWGERPTSDGDITGFLDGLNADWVKSSKRLSPAVLIELLEISGRQVSEYFSQLSPDDPAVFAVSWAGESSSLNWFDIAREYTEKWHHQQQIRDAVDRPGIMTPELYAPVISTFMRVLPFSYRSTPAPEGTRIRFHVSGNCGGDWTLLRLENTWELRLGSEAHNSAEVEIPGELAWKLFTKGLNAETVERTIIVRGDRALGQPALTAKAIVG